MKESDARFTPPSPLMGVVMILNRLLREDAPLRATLVPFAGKIARFTMAPFSLSLQVDETGLFVYCDHQPSPAVTIELPLASAATVAMGSAPLTSRIKIVGDADFAEVLGRLAAELRPDVEEDLSRLVGDVAVVRLVGGARFLIDAVIEVQKRIAANVVEYLVHEKPLLVEPAAILQFVDEVRVLRDDLARLEKRVERLGSGS